MLDGWGIEGAMIYTQTRETYTLTGGQKQYTWGVGGDINTASPFELREAFITQGDITYSNLEIIDWSQYALLQNKEFTGVPSQIYIDYNYPLVNLFLYLVPSLSYVLHLYSHKPLSNFTSLDETISMPKGWERALKYNLAIEIAPMYDKDPAPAVVKIADESKRAVKASIAKNDKDLLRADEASIVMGSETYFNIYTGTGI